MGKTFEQGKDEVAKLCAHFRVNRDAFRACNEAQIRQQLINPFFEALGWDVGNTGQVAPQYAEVLTEQSQDDEGPRKAPDYTFRVGTLPKFYAEAKRCSIDISSDPAPAFQLRRYGWNPPGLSPSLLTNFEDLGVYDCTVRPRQSDKASRSRISLYHFHEYADRWRELWNIFSREAVWSGAFDQYAASTRKRGTSEFDAEFLKEIEGWRDTLARNIALRNQELSSDDLNAAVQATIDRVVFLRMAEDRGLERYEELLRLCERDGVYPRFMRKLCRKADEKYNSGLFHFQREEGVSEAPDRITPSLAVDDRVFKPILQSLYFQHGSPYHFGLMPVEILGTVYERFLGKVIRLTAGHQAKVEEKPAVRKAGGVYYTPAYIVDYIVKETVGSQIEGRSPAQLAGGQGKPPFRVLDMACGSGSFLLRAYQRLLDHCLKWYLEHGPDTQRKAVYEDPHNDHWRLTIEEKKRILTTHIFGVDIDAQAVEVSKLSLLLKVLEGENERTVERQLRLFHERALPNLADNIKCGNSLIGPDYLVGRLVCETEEWARTKPFDWQREFPADVPGGGFDCVIGNPPYGAELSTDEAEYLGRTFQVSPGNPDTFALFIEQSLRRLKPGGQLSMIVPTGWYSGAKFAALRMHVTRHCDPRVFINLPYDIFHAWVDTTIFVLVKRSRPTQWPREAKCRVTVKTFPKRHKIGDISEFNDRTAEVEFTDWFRSGSDEFLTYADQRTNDLIRKVQRLGQPLGKLSDVQRGVTPFELSRRPTHKTSRRALAGTVRRYSLEMGEQSYVRFDQTLAEPKPERYFVGPRLLLRELISRQFRLQAVKVSSDFVTNKSMQSILSTPGGPELGYILGILNSRLMSWYFLMRSNVGQRDDFPKIVLKETRALPIRSADLGNAGQRKAHDRMVALVDSMLTLHGQLASASSEAQRTTMQRQIDSTDQEIDRLVYELYGLTAEEIAIVETSSR